MSQWAEAAELFRWISPIPLGRFSVSSSGVLILHIFKWGADCICIFRVCTTDTYNCTDMISRGAPPTEIVADGLFAVLCKRKSFSYDVVYEVNLTICLHEKYTAKPRPMRIKLPLPIHPGGHVKRLTCKKTKGIERCG